jgi:hypothetical protein
VKPDPDVQSRQQAPQVLNRASARNADAETRTRPGQQAVESTRRSRLQARCVRRRRKRCERAVEIQHEERIRQAREALDGLKRLLE